MVAGYTHIPSISSLYIREYFERLTLVKLGFQFDASELDDYEAQIYSIIDSAIIEARKKK